MEALQARFRERAARDLALFQRHLAADDLGAAAVEEAAHKLSGAAAIFGFPGIGEAARAVDRMFSAGGRPDREALEALTARLAEAARADAGETPLQTAGASGGGETILLVEDDDLIREHTERQLRGLGYQVIAAADGDALLAGFGALPPVDLLFTDLMLPGAADGAALARTLRTARPGLRVLFTSGRSAPPTGRAASPGAPFLAKPYRREALAAKVREALDQPRPPGADDGA